jgi:hypothetical protein
LLSACRRSISALGASGPVPPWLKMHTPRRNDLPRVVLHHDLQAFWACPHFFLPQSAVNSTGLSNSASPSDVRKVRLSVALAFRPASRRGNRPKYRKCLTVLQSGWP